MYTHTHRYTVMREAGSSMALEEVWPFNGRAAVPWKRRVETGDRELV